MTKTWEKLVDLLKKMPGIKIKKIDNYLLKKILTKYTFLSYTNQF